MKKSGGLKYRTRLIISFLLSIVITIMAGMYSYLSSQLLMSDTAEMFSKNLELTALYRDVSAIQQELEIYLSTSSSESLLAFYDYTSTIQTNANKLLESASYTPRGIKIKNVSNMILHYLGQGENTVNAKRGRNIEVYTKGYERTVKEQGYIIRYIEEIMSNDLIDSAEKYAVINNRVQQVTLFNNVLIGVVVIFVTIIIIIFSFQITKPITKLASYAKEISEGNFEVHIPPSNTSGEIHVLYNVFNLMVINIKEYIHQIQEKRRLEKTLSEQLMNNLKMKNALRESELLALQSQVNPHFIFNTINIGAKIAMLQGDNITCTYLENAADIFRYNLRGLDSNATLKEEIENVVSYMYLLQTRFGDMVHFELEEVTSEVILNFTLPRMTLQPLIENAYIHGISDLEDGGMIGLKLSEDKDYVYVTVWDNGKGLSKEKIDQLLGDQEAFIPLKTPQRGHTTGIGVDNVLKRLRLYYGIFDVMSIERTGKETRFILMLPKLKERRDKHV